MEINQKVYQLSGKSNLCRESSFTFSVIMHSRKSGKCTEDAGVQVWHHIHSALQMLQEEMEILLHRES